MKPMLSRLALFAFLALWLAACGGGMAQTGTPATDPAFPQLRDGKWWADPTGRISRDLLQQLQKESVAVKQDRFELGGVFFTNCASDPTQLAINFANHVGMGNAEKNNGVTIVLLLDRPGKDGNAPTIAIATGDGIKDYLTKAVLDRILERDFYPARSDGQWEKGLIKTIQTIHRVLKDPAAEELQTPKKNPWVFWIVIIAIVVVGALGGFSGGGTTTRRGGTRTHTRTGGGGHSSSGTSG